MVIHRTECFTEHEVPQLMTAVSSLLLIEGDAVVAQSVRDMLIGEPFEVQCAENLSEGAARLKKGGFGAVLLNLRLPDSKGIETFDSIFAISPACPILIIGNLDIEELAVEALHRGAQDYLLKPHLNRHSLTRALHNTIERKPLKEALFQEKERAQVMLNCIGDAVLSTDLSGNVNYLNVVAERMTGWPWKEASGRPIAEVLQIIDGTTREPARSPLDLAIQQDKIVGLAANCILIRRDGYESRIEDSCAPIHDGQGDITGAVMVFHDVSVARAMAIQMSHLAQHDCLTDLPNRILLKDRLTQSIALSRRRQQPACPAVSGFRSLQKHQRLSGICHRRSIASIRRRACGNMPAIRRYVEPCGRGRICGNACGSGKCRRIGRRRQENHGRARACRTGSPSTSFMCR